MDHQSKQPELSIIIVSWNVRDLLRESLRSIEATRGELDPELFVVDNASSDGSPAMIREEFPAVILIALPRNIGFGAGNNIALREARGKAILLLNPDTRLLPGMLDTMIELIRRPAGPGMIGPQILDEKLRVDPSCRRFPTMPAALAQFTVAKYLPFMRGAFHDYMMTDFDHRREADVDQIMGACMLVRREVIDQVGLFDESFFMFYEEVDWCYRIRTAGHRIVFTPDARLIHLSDRSTSQVWDAMLFQKIKSLFHYFSKHRSPTRLRVFKPVFKIAFLLKVVLDFCTFSLKSWKYRLIRGKNDESGNAVKYRRRAEQTGDFLKNHTRRVMAL